ncbi:MAG: septum formation protein Maf [Lachnospiraceae bacterium]|nr:septum formation protein Maf [Lachnospiraceae bacterium]
MKIENIRIILASKSPRRKELIEGAGFKTLIIPSDADENIEEKDPAELVKKLSDIKAISVYESEKENIKENDVVLGADTVVYAGGRILGKPSDKDEAREMIQLLAGNVHSVFTGFTLVFDNGKTITDYAETKVYVYPMSDEEIEDYISTNEPYDKAGAYGIQGLFGKYVEKIDGDYNNVVGLPVSKILNMLK